MINTRAYLYKWTHKTSHMWYVGSRTRKNCHPGDNYICSSKSVKPLIINNRNEWVREILCIGLPKDIRVLEARYLTKLDAKNNPMSFNKHNGDGKFSSIGIAPWNKDKSGLQIAWNKNLSSEQQPFYGKTFTDVVCKKLSESQKGSNNSMYGKDPWNKGLTGLYTQSDEANEKRRIKLVSIPRSEETKAKIRATKAANKQKAVNKSDATNLVSTNNQRFEITGQEKAMLAAFKKLVESGVMTEETTQVVEAAFSAKLQENRDQVTAQLREEFAQKYSHDKTVMVEAIDKMLSERLAAEMAELVEDKKALVEAKIAYGHKMKGDANILESFILSQLGKELVEFQGDRQKVSENFTKLEQFIVHALAKEINEFAQDKRELAEAKVKLVREAKTQFASIKTQFIKRSANIVKESVSKQLKFEVKQLKEDIDSARQNDFGRRLFEAFATEFSGSYLNEKSETSKLLKILDKKDMELAEAKQALSQKQVIVESTQRDLRVAKDMATRKAMMSEMLAPLGADKRELMHSLLESVHTSKLSVAFDKYLPAVMEGEKKKPAKATLTEGTAVTGNKESKPQVGLDNILDIRKLAGLK